LHSYGFMDRAFPWLIAFGVSQLIVMALGSLLPLNLWRSRIDAGTPQRRGITTRSEVVTIVGKNTA